MLKVLSISAALSLLFMSGAMAQSGGAGACVADIKKVCGSVEPGGRRIANCLKERLSDVSDACKARMAAFASARTACRADVEKQCGTKTRRSQKVVCLKEAVTNLGDECKAAIAAAVTREK